MVHLISGVSTFHYVPGNIALIKPVSSTAHAAVKLCNCPVSVHLEQEGANYKLVYSLRLF